MKRSGDVFVNAIQDSSTHGSNFEGFDDFEILSRIIAAALDSSEVSAWRSSYCLQLGVAVFR